MCVAILGRLSLFPLGAFLSPEAPRSERMERSKGPRLNGWIESPNALRWCLGQSLGCAFTVTKSSEIIIGKLSRPPPTPREDCQARPVTMQGRNTCGSSRRRRPFLSRSRIRKARCHANRTAGTSRILEDKEGLRGLVGPWEGIGFTTAEQPAPHRPGRASLDFVAIWLACTLY